MNPRHLIWSLACTLLTATALHAQVPATPAIADPVADPSPESIATIEIRGQRKAGWPYRAYLEGLDAFESDRKLAPQGELRFRLRPSSDTAVPADLHMTVDSDRADQPVSLPVTDGRFVLPRLPAFDRSDALLTYTRPAGAFSQHMPLADVRTPGLPANVMRLGDLRLSCRVSVAVVKAKIKWYQSAAFSSLIGTTDWCKNVQSGTFSLRSAFPFNVLTLRDGAREQKLVYSAFRTSIPVPLEKDNWGNDTLITLEAIEGAVPTASTAREHVLSLSF